MSHTPLVVPDAVANLDTGLIRSAVTGTCRDAILFHHRQVKETEISMLFCLDPSPFSSCILSL